MLAITIAHKQSPSLIYTLLYFVSYCSLLTLIKKASSLSIYILLLFKKTSCCSNQNKVIYICMLNLKMASFPKVLWNWIEVERFCSKKAQKSPSTLLYHGGFNDSFYFHRCLIRISLRSVASNPLSIGCNISHCDQSVFVNCMTSSSALFPMLTKIRCIFRLFKKLQIPNVILTIMFHFTNFYFQLLCVRSYRNNTISFDFWRRDLLSWLSSWN